MAPEILPCSPEGKPYRLGLDVMRPVVKRYDKKASIKGRPGIFVKIYYMFIDIIRFWPAACRLYEFSNNGAAVEYFTQEEFRQLSESGVLVFENKLNESSRVLRG